MGINAQIMNVTKTGNGEWEIKMGKMKIENGKLVAFNTSDKFARICFEYENHRN